jgi:hypothetical protein
MWCENSTSLSSTAPTDRRRARGLGRAGHRDVALAGHQARGRVQADPAGAGQVDLAPGVQVGEVDLGARRAVERLHVGLELDQVAGDESAPPAPGGAAAAPAASRCRGTSRWPCSASARASARRAPCGSGSRSRAAGAGSADQEVDRALLRRATRCRRRPAAAASAAPWPGRARGRAQTSARRRTGSARPRARGRSRTGCRPTSRPPGRP